MKLKLGLMHLLSAMVCFASVFAFGILGPWAREPPTIFVVPTVIFIFWLAVILWIVKHSQNKVRAITIAALKAPFAFGWPIWIVLFIIGEGMRKH